MVEAKPPAPLSATEIQHWLDEFADLIDDLDGLDAAEAGRSSPDRVRRDTLPAPHSDSRIDDEVNKPPPGEEPNTVQEDDSDLANPFPPGYGEDLLRPDADL